MNPFDPGQETTPVGSVTIFGVPVRPGDRVRIWPQKSADIFDMALKGKLAIVEAIESDFDNQGDESMSTRKIIELSTLAATVWSLIYFRGDIQRYVRMKRM